MINIDLLKDTLVWFVWLIRDLSIYLLVFLLIGLAGLCFELDNIAQLEACAAKLEAAQGNERSSYDQHKSI